MASKKSVAILGGSSHVAKNLIAQNSYRQEWDIVAYGRNPQVILDFAKQLDIQVSVEALDPEFSCSRRFDAVVNCIGFGTPNKVRSAGHTLFSLAEATDNQILKYLETFPTTRYLNFSSGAVYGSALEKPVAPGHTATIELDPMIEADFYRISKIHQEAKHRSLKDRSIVDLRLFNFFSRHIDTLSGYLMTEVVECLSTGTPLKTNANNIFRDYVAPVDLFSFLNGVIVSEPTNDAVDIYSAQPIDKIGLLDQVAACFGLRVETTGSSSVSPTGVKPYYYSTNRKAESTFNYHPTMSSWDSIRTELEAMGFRSK